MTIQSPCFAGIDAGGTTFKCGVSDANGNVLSKHRVHVTTPEETLSACAEYFKSVTSKSNLKALGIASFGPIDIDRTSKTYGTILATPKPNWAGTDLREFFTYALATKTVVDTDVNGALLAEMTTGAAQSASSAVYITIGTGIGAGIYLNGHFAGQPTHPEFGHIPIKRHSDDTSFAGICPFHGDCLEGLTSVSSMRARWGEPKDLAPDHQGWVIAADYLAQACRVLTLTLRVERIILGGGLMLAPHLLDMVRSAYDRQMANYLGDRTVAGRTLIDRPALGDDAGLCGALLLASQHQ